MCVVAAITPFDRTDAVPQPRVYSHSPHIAMITDVDECAGCPDSGQTSPIADSLRDSLTLVIAKQVAKTYRDMHATIAVHPTLAFPKAVSDSAAHSSSPPADSSAMAAMTMRTHIEQTQLLSRSVAHAGLTPERYAQYWARIQSSWRYVLVEHHIVNDGGTMGDIGFLGVKPPMADIRFVREHHDDLHAMGLPAPALPKL